ncbi:MAG: hypothetical protein R3F22_08890 [Lysobacteraceae bacterium]
MKAWLETGTPIVLAIAASLAVFLNLILVGPMSWHFQQPAAVQGGIEVALLLSLLAFFASRDGKWRWLGIGLLLALYLRRHHVDLPVFITLLVAEGLVGAGALADRRSTSTGAWAGIRRLVLGLCLWLAVLLILHAGGLATPKLSLALLLLLGLVMPLLRRRSAVVASGLRAFAARPPLERACWALLAGWFAVLMARSNHVIGFDTLWYLIRGEYVLAPNGSFFEPLGLVSAVHYFPKLWELLLLPWSAARDLSFAVGFNLVLLTGGLLAVALLLRQLGLRQSLLPLALLAIATLPAIASTALLLKTDIAAWMFCMVALAAAARWFQRGGTEPLIWGFCGIGLACCAKLTPLPYMGMVVLIVLAVALMRHRAGQDTKLPVSSASVGSSSWLLLGLTLCIGLSILWRTLLTSGLPTIGPDPLVAIWNLLGMHLRPPAGSLQWLWPQDWSDAPWLLPEALFAPNELSKIRIGWTGNFWLLCGLLALLWRATDGSGKQWNRALRMTLWVVALTGLMLFLGWKYHSRGSDGNYFIVAVSAACCLGLAAASRAATTAARRQGLIALLLICSGWQAALGFVSAGWSPPGTRGFDLDFGRTVLDSKKTFAQKRASAGLEPVYRALKGLPDDTRVIGVGDSVDVHLLPLRVEALEAILFSRPEYLQSADAVRGFLSTACIAYVVVGDDVGVRGGYVISAVERLGSEVLLTAGKWTLYRLPGCPDEQPIPAPDG